MNGLKCTRNEELEGEINILNQIKEKYDGLMIEHEEYMEQNNKLKKENALLNNSVLSACIFLFYFI